MNDNSREDNRSPSDLKTLDLFKKILEYASYFLGLAFIIGFLIWNFYLYGLGFKEDNIIQTRFVLSGVIFIILALLLFFIIELLYNLSLIGINFFRRTKFKKNKIIKSLTLNDIFTGIIILIVCIFLYVILIFPFIPSGLGGGAPRVIEVLTDKINMVDLTKLGIQPAESSEIQTQQLCVAYENDSTQVILLSDRILHLKKDKYYGSAYLPGVSQLVSNNYCKKNAKYWLLKSYFCEILTNSKFCQK
ncbi:MAG TPA: hypothetical protein VLK22_00845 [Candidatus Udaeobacter sp.]|nr:hypothetical protein [Candidatus Udaeobacter sp.]